MVYLQVVEQTFLDLIEKDGTISKTLEVVKENNIADWGSDVSFILHFLYFLYYTFERQKLVLTLFIFCYLRSSF